MRVQLLSVSLAVCAAFSSITSAQPSFQGLGDLPGGYFFSRAEAISGDGSVVVGYSVGASGHEEAFRWTPADGMQALGDLPGGAVRSAALGVSRDGTVIVGKSDSGTYPTEGFRWTAESGIVGLPREVFPESYYCGSAAVAVSDNGQVILGLWCDRCSTCSFHSPGVGFRLVLPSDWMDFGGIEMHMNSDGTVIVGGSGSSYLYRYIFLPDGSIRSELLYSQVGVSHDVSPDGNVVVGRLISSGQAFRWSPNGMRILPNPQSDWYETVAYGVAADGSVVVGSGRRSDVGGDRAFIWDESHGMRLLQEVLEVDYALDLTGWTLSQALDVSDDGKTIIGIGEHDGNSPEAWVAHLPTYPVPVIPTVSASGAIVLGALLVTTGAIVLSRRRTGSERAVSSRLGG